MALGSSIITWQLLPKILAPGDHIPHSIHQLPTANIPDRIPTGIARLHTISSWRRMPQIARLLATLVIVGLFTLAACSTATPEPIY